MWCSNRLSIKSGKLSQCVVRGYRGTGFGLLSLCKTLFRSQQGHPTRYDFYGTHTDVSSTTTIQQFSYRKCEWMVVHSFTGHRLQPAYVLVHNKYLYMIGGIFIRNNETARTVS